MGTFTDKLENWYCKMLWAISFSKVILKQFIIGRYLNSSTLKMHKLYREIPFSQNENSDHVAILRTWQLAERLSERM